MITGDQILAHLVGDYLLQSDWMAQEKTKRTVAALAHALCYTLPFVLLTQSPVALGLISGTHFVIDRWRLARYVCWAKNWLAPPEGRPAPWSQCQATGYSPDRPPWLSVWLLIIADNTLHLLCNGLSLAFF